MKKFILNLSFISEPHPSAAEIVVSEIMERLSPKYEPPITAAPTTATFRCAPCATLIAIGAIAAIVPMDVPIDVEIKQHIKNTPGTNSFTGIKCRQRFTTESFPPIAAAAPWNPPAIR